MVTGSLQVKNGTYYAVLSFFNKDKNKWDQKWKTTKIKNKKGNKKLAENKLKEILETFEKELGEEEKKKEEELKETPFSKRLKENKNKSFLKYLLESIEEFKNNIEVTTYDNWKQMYEGRITNFFTPYNELKKVMDQEVKRKTKYKKLLTIANITQFDLEDFFSWLYNCDLKSSTVKKYYTLFSLVFDRAIRQKIFTLDTNPMKDIKKPVVKPYIADFYTSKELKQLFEIAKGDVLEIPIIIAVHYGLRRSETLGLKWNAIDFENNTIIIKHTVTKVTGCGENQVIVSKDLTKTSSGYRTMPLTEEVKKKLLEHKEKIKENKKLFGNTYIQQTKDYICVKENGELIKPNHFTKRFKKIIRRNPIKEVRLHDLRHSVGSLLALKNVNQKLIQDYLGHANISSSNIYMHLQYQSKLFSSDIIESELEK